MISAQQDFMVRVASHGACTARAAQGRDLQCWCPLTSPWCHAEVLLDLANG